MWTYGYARHLCRVAAPHTKFTTIGERTHEAFFFFGEGNMSDSLIENINFWAYIKATKQADTALFGTV